MNDNCGCCHNHAHHGGDEQNLKLFLARLAAALAIVLVFSFVSVPFYISIFMFVTAYLLAGFEVLFSAVKNLFRGKLFDEMFLMAAASIAAFIIGDFPEAVAIMIFFGAGELLQNMAVAKSKNNITKLMDIRPDFANLKSGECTDPRNVKIGDIIIVKPGEKVPLDGIVIKGSSFLDTKALTGESVPRMVDSGSEVLSGMLNQDGVLEVRVQKEFGESTVSKILELVQHASDKKSKSEKFITKFAKIYTPVVVFTALVVAVVPPVAGFGTFSDWIYRAITFLIVSCPCALVISIPIGVFGGIGGAARNGILIKGGNHLETLNQIKAVAFDKTGTLTKGVFEVSEIKAEGWIRASELLEFATIAEQHSTHPIAKSILAHYGKKVIHDAKINETSGQGITAMYRGKTIHVGSKKLMQSIGITVLPEFLQTTVHVAVNRKYAGYILIADKIKDDAKAGLAALKVVGISKTIMLTGDNAAIAQSVVMELGIDEFHAELLPQDKAAEFEKIKAGTSGKTAFAGDGINDAPVLALADLGIAMGGIGSDAAIESADIVLMNDDIKKIATAKKIAKKTRKIILQNITLALGVKAAVMALAFFGITSIWMAIFADVGVAFLAILNATRCLSVKHNKKSD